MVVEERALIAVVLAGGDGSDLLARHAEVTSKVMVPYQGKPLGRYVLEALQDSCCVSHVVYVGSGSRHFEGLFDLSVPSGQRFVDSIALGLGAALALGGSSRLLLVSADLPWLTAAVTDRFIEGAPPADLVYPIIPQAASLAQFPKHKRTYARLRSGRFTGGNLVLLRAAIIPRLLPFLDRLYRARKNPLALSGILGFDVVLALLFGRAELSGLERRGGSLLGARIRAFVTEDAALGADVDKLEHLLEIS